jgi:regulatory protein
MANEITALQLQKHNSERVSVFVDGEYAFSVGLLRAAELAKGQRLSDAEMEELRQDGEVDLLYQRALRYLGMRPRSVGEMHEYLTRKKVELEVIEVILGRLRQQGYLDDESFANFWVENRTRFRPKGARALRYELRQKRVDNETIDESLEGLDDAEAAWAAAEPKLSRFAALPQDEFNQKLMGFLARRGFDFGVCRRTAERAWQTLHG